MSHRNGAEWLPGTAGAEPRGSAAAPEEQREDLGGTHVGVSTCYDVLQPTSCDHWGTGRKAHGSVISDNGP